MPFERPSLKQLVETTQADIEARLPGADAHLRRNVLEVLSIMHAGAMHGEYGAIDYVSRQILPDKADEEMVLRWANMLGLFRLTGNNATGTILVEKLAVGVADQIFPEGTLMKSSRGGQTYKSISSVTVPSKTGGSAEDDVGIPIRVISAASGVLGNLVGGTTLNLISPIAHIQSQVLVNTAGITGGVDAETVEALRARVLQRLRQPPRGGARHDYIAWAQAADPRVSRVFVSPHEAGDGTVTVRFVMDGEENIIPSAEDPILGEVKNYIANLAPVDLLNLSVIPPQKVIREITVNKLVASPGFSAQQLQETILNEVKDLFSREAVPGKKIPDSKIDEAFSIAEGESDHAITIVAKLENGTVLSADDYSKGQMDVLGSDIVWPVN